MDLEKERQQFKNRLKDLAEKSYTQGIFTFSAFLSLSDQDVFHSLERELAFAGLTLFGGMEGTERVMVRFGSVKELGYEVDFPIVCLHIAPLQKKFSDELSHRDFLGALMHLGIARDCLGDIKAGQREAYLFCTEQIAPFIIDNLTQIKHTMVRVSMVQEPGDMPIEEPKSLQCQVPSLRMDAVIAKVYNLSRESSLELFRAGKVYLNGRLCESNAKNLQPGDVINVRGKGKFVLQEGMKATKKGKLAITAAVYQ